MKTLATTLITTMLLTGATAFSQTPDADSLFLFGGKDKPHWLFAIEVNHGISKQRNMNAFSTSLFQKNGVGISFTGGNQRRTYVFPSTMKIQNNSVDVTDAFYTAGSTYNYSINKNFSVGAGLNAGIIDFTIPIVQSIKCVRYETTGATEIKWMGPDYKCNDYDSYYYEYEFKKKRSLLITGELKLNYSFKYVQLNSGLSLACSKKETALYFTSGIAIGKFRN
jgi:hypothetical protein